MTCIRILLCFAAALLLPLNGVSQVSQHEKDAAMGVVSRLEGMSSVSSGQMLAQAALSRLGTPYVAGLLDPDGPEQLQMVFTETDCMIFVETCLATVLTARSGDPSYDNYAAILRRLRYRADSDKETAAPPIRYDTRLHYSTDWIRNLEKRGIAEDLTLSCAGVRSSTKLDFMSRNYKKYKQLAESDTDPDAAGRLRLISESEARINAVPMTYVPKALIKAIEGDIETGDLIFYTTSVAGLDISHCAIAYVNDGKCGFIHASSVAGEVIIDSRSIAEYAASQKSCTGIKIVRLED